MVKNWRPSFLKNKDKTKAEKIWKAAHEKLGDDVSSKAVRDEAVEMWEAELSKKSKKKSKKDRKERCDKSEWCQFVRDNFADVYIENKPISGGNHQDTFAITIREVAKMYKTRK